MKPDPVCRMWVDEQTASATTVYKGELYAFCGRECKHRFLSDPERYVGESSHAYNHAPHEPEAVLL